MLHILVTDFDSLSTLVFGGGSRYTALYFVSSTSQTSYRQYLAPPSTSVRPSRVCTELTASTTRYSIEPNDFILVFESFTESIIETSDTECVNVNCQYWGWTRIFTSGADIHRNWSSYDFTWKYNINLNPLKVGTIVIAIQ